MIPASSPAATASATLTSTANTAQTDMTFTCTLAASAEQHVYYSVTWYADTDDVSSEDLSVGGTESTLQVTSVFADLFGKEVCIFYLISIV